MHRDIQLGVCRWAAFLVLLAASSASADFLPFPSVGNLRLRLEADMGVTLSGANVSAWADQSGNSFNAAQGNAAMQPLFVANASQNGLFPVLRFDGGRPRPSSGGTGDSLVNTVNNIASPTNTGTTTFVVWRPQVNGAAGESLPFYFGAPGTAGNLRGLYIANGNTDPLNVGTAGWGAGDIPNQYLVAANSYRIATFSLNDARNLMDMYDRTLSTSQSDLANAVAGLTNVGVGYGVGGGDVNAGAVAGYGFRGDISAVLVYTGQLSNTDRLSVEAYLYSKYFADQPATVPEPTSLALFGAALGGMGLFVWRRRAA